MLAIAAGKLTEVAQRDDVVMADNQILQQLDYLHQWRLADDGLLSGRGGGPTGGGGRFMNADRDPNDPSPQQTKKWKLFQDKYGGMPAAERELALSAALKNWAGSGKVYFIGAESELDELGTLDFDKTQFKILQRIPLPAAPEDDGGGMRRGRGGPGGPRRGGRNFQPPPPGFGPPPGGPGGFGPGPGPGPGGMRPMPSEYVIAEWLEPPAPKAISQDLRDDFR